MRSDVGRAARSPPRRRRRPGARPRRRAAAADAGARSRRCSPALAATVADGAIAAAPVTDTIKEVGRRGRSSSETLDRSRAVGGADAAGVPPRGARARARVARRGGSRAATDDAWLVERAGGRVIVVPAPAENLKVTTPLDLQRRRAAARRARGPRTILLESPPCMLTDYHLHLRPDAPRRGAGDALHAGQRRALPRGRRRERGIAELGVSEHVHRFEQALEVWDHPFWREHAHDDLDDYCAFVRERDRPAARASRPTSCPAREDRIAEPARGARLDYVVGSVHFLGDGAVDMERLQRLGAAGAAPRSLAALLRDARRGGAQRPVRHPRAPRPREDVGLASRPLPEGDLRRYYEPALEAIAETGIAVEVSTAGLRKPVGEIYPAPGVPRDVRSRRARPSRSRATPTGPRTSASATTMRSSCSTRSASASCACSRTRAPLSRSAATPAARARAAGDERCASGHRL